MITLAQYVGVHAKHKDWTAMRKTAALELLIRVNKLIGTAELAEMLFRINPKTKSQVSGETLGGFRPQDCPIGAPNSNHKEGRGIDIYDPGNLIDGWCMDNLPALAAAGIWLEHPTATPGWVHWQSTAPRSGNRVFRP